MQNKSPYLTSEFIQDFRNRIGDSSKSVPPSYIIGFINTALRRLPRQRGLERLYERHDTWELSYLNKDGTPSASWDLGNIGKILDIRSLKVLKTVNGAVCDIIPRYLEYHDFVRRFTLPEQKEPGDPCYYTYEQIGTITRLVFDRPPRDLIVLDMLYSAFFPKIVTPSDPILLAWEYSDILEEYVIILHKIETTDQSTARALWEDLDVLAADAIDLLARTKTASGYRMVARSW